MVMGQYLSAVEGMNERFTLVGGGRELCSCLVVQKSDCRKADVEERSLNSFEMRFHSYVS